MHRVIISTWRESKPEREQAKSTLLLRGHTRGEGRQDLVCTSGRRRGGRDVKKETAFSANPLLSQNAADKWMNRTCDKYRKKLPRIPEHAL